MNRFLTFLLAFLFINPTFAQENKADHATPDPAKTHQKFLELRQALFEADPTDYGLKQSKKKDEIFGVIVDLHLSSKVKTISAFVTGDANVYNSRGTLNSGGEKVPAINALAIDLTATAESLLSKSEKTSDLNIPEKGFARFYLITNNGTQMHQEEMGQMERNKTEWKALMDKALKIERAFK